MGQRKGQGSEDSATEPGGKESCPVGKPGGARGGQGDSGRRTLGLARTHPCFLRPQAMGTSQAPGLSLGTPPCTPDQGC